MNVHQPQTFLQDLRRRAGRWVPAFDDDGTDVPRAEPPPRAGPTRTAPAAQAPTEEVTCRICFGGTEEEPTLGKLFSPCLCRGTMSKVHTGCLDEWRRQSRGQRSFFQCDQCGFRYRIGRTRIAGLASSPQALMAFTAFLLFVLAFLAGNLSYAVLDATDLLPSTPPFAEWLWYFGATSQGSPLFWGDVIHGGIEESLDVFTLPSWLTAGPLGWVFARMSLGAAVLGILSFLQLAASWALLGHLHHMRLFRRRVQGRDGRPGQRADLTALVVAGLVLFGLYRAFNGLYRLTRRGARTLLMRLEQRVLEVRT